MKQQHQENTNKSITYPHRPKTLTLCKAQAYPAKDGFDSCIQPSTESPRQLIIQKASEIVHLASSLVRDDFVCRKLRGKHYAVRSVVSAI
jgi:hypothetical protein